VKQISVFRINLNDIEGSGEFPCPSCEAIISPDDETERTYIITDIETYEDGSLKTLTLQCNKCHATIILEGFEALNKLENPSDI